MTIEIVMPAMEMAQDNATLVAWLKQEGEYVNKGQALLTIETDKVNVDIEAPGAGYLANVRARAGDKVPVGQVIAELVPELVPAKGTPPAATVKTIAISPLAERLAREFGVEPSAIKPKGARIEKADVMAYVDAQRAPAGEPPVKARLAPATPQARRLAREHQLDVAALPTSGAYGAVRVRDVERAIETARAAAASQPAPIAAPIPGSPVSAPAPSDEYRVVPIAGIRKKIAERLQASYQTAPHIALTLSADMTEVQRLVEQLNPLVLEQAGHALTITTVLAKLVSGVLLRYPRVNAHLVGDELREYNAVHLGIAVALDEGLIVPVVRDANQKGLAQIQAEVTDLATRARAGGLKPGEVRGSTFTLSNLGMFEIETFTAILNPPEVGILSIGSITDTAVKVDGQIVMRPSMRFTLNADHRAVDGAVAARFLQSLKQVIERPYRVLA